MLFKRKRIPFPIPGDARKLTEEEMILVNGGAEEKKESQESKSESVTVKSGNTLSGIVSDYNKANGTNYTVSDVAKNSGISNPDVIYPGQEIKFGSSSSTSGTSGSSNISTSSSVSSSSVSMTNTGNACAANATKDQNYHGACDQQFINEMMEKEQKKNVGGNGVTGNNIDSHIVKKSKNIFAKEFLASIYEGSNAGYVIDHENKIIKTNWSDKKALAQAKEKLQDYETLEAGYKLVAYDEKTDDFLSFRCLGDVINYQAFEKMGVYENNPNGSDAYFIYTYTEDDRGMKEFERSSIYDDIRYLQKKGLNVKVI